MAEEKYVTMRSRTIMLSPCYWNGLSQTALRVEQLFGIKIDIYFQHYNPENLEFKAFYIKKNWDNSGNILSDKLLDEKFFHKISNNYNKLLSQTEDFINQIYKLDLSVLDLKKSLKLIRQVQEQWVEYDIANVSPWFVAGDSFKLKIEDQLKIEKDDFLLLSTPLEKTEASQLEYQLLVAARQVKNGEKEISLAARELSKRYGWLNIGYDEVVLWDKEYFIKELQKKIGLNYLAAEIDKFDQETSSKKEKYNELIKKYKLSKSDLGLVARLNTLAVWTDQRKRIAFQLHCFLNQILNNLGVQYNLTYKQMKYLFTEELELLEKNLPQVQEILKNRLAKSFIVRFVNGKYDVLDDHEFALITKELEAQTQSSEIKGSVASKGTSNIYQGKVTILKTAQESNKLEQGDFLVATMTSPDYIVAMGKAAGFITDEGGVTCHAAIVAREMNKPCIIGTKIATQVLKDGDMVEIDVVNGIVKILK